MANTSYIRILQAIESFASQHLQVKKFASDFPAQIPNFGNKNENYPILFVSPSTSIFNENTNTFELKVYCFDIINKDRRNINTILSDTNNVLNDLTLWLQYGELDGIDMLDTSSEAIPINNSLLDYAAGWELTVTLEVNRYSLCEVPFNNIPAVIDICNNIAYPQYLTCTGLDNCPTITGITNDITNLKNKPDIFITGGTYSNGTATFRNNSGTTFSVSGFSTSTGGSLTGGTTNYIPKWSSTSGLTSSGLYDGGNFWIGLGTNAPRSVGGYANITLESLSGGSIHFRSSGSTDIGGLVADINSVQIRTLTAIHPITFAINGTEKARLSTNGNLLLNTGSDNGIDKLQINAGSALIGGNVGIGIGATTIPTERLFILNPDGGVSAMTALRLATFTTSNGAATRIVMINSTSPTFAENSGQGLYLDAIRLASGKSAFAISTSNGGFPVEALRVTDLRNLLVNTITDDTTSKIQVVGDIKKKITAADTSYTSILNGEMVLGARGGGTVPMIASRTSSTVSTGMFKLAIQNADVIRTTESDMIFRTGFETGNTIQPLTTAGNAFSFQNSTTGLVHIFRNGNMLISTTTSVDNSVDKLQVVGSIKANQYKLNALNTAPTSSGDTGTLGEIRYDANFMYVCVATNQWKRSPLTSW